MTIESVDEMRLLEGQLNEVCSSRCIQSIMRIGTASQGKLAGTIFLALMEIRGAIEKEISASEKDAINAITPEEVLS